MRRWLMILVALAMIAAACTPAEEAPLETTASTTTATSAPATTIATTSQPPTTFPIPSLPVVSTSAFGTLIEVPLREGGPAYTGPDHPNSLSSVAVEDWLAGRLSDSGATPTLTENGFVVVPATHRFFEQVYEGARYNPYPVFVTTDAAYHVWHLVFDKILREVEQQSLLPALDSLVARLVAGARAQEAELAGGELADAASRVTQFYEAAATVLGLDVGEIGPLATAEVELIMAANGPALSPTVGGDADSGFITTQTDYSLFRPRGHYTRNAELERYFRAMSQLGNNGFLLTESLPLGILASRVVVADSDATAFWRLIYGPTAWLVGAADDYTPAEVSEVIESVVPTGWSDLSVFAASDTLTAVRDGLLSGRAVAINPEAASVRIMGSRWVLDSFVLDQLVAPNVARDTASPLDVAAAFGSEWAYGIQEAAGETAVPGYVEGMAELRDLIDERTIEDWSATVYDAWLWAIEPMWQPHGDEFPEFMQGAAWAAKAHQTGFGSYAELKHDTILYTKQAVAEGGGEEPPPPPRHWVEPDPVAFLRLAAVADLMRGGLDERSLLTDEYRTMLTDLVEFLSWLGAIAEDELAGLAVDEEDVRRLAGFGDSLYFWRIRTSDFDIDWESGPDDQAALVADIMRNAAGVLEVGTGYIDEIYVLVPNWDGGFQVAVGGVYSYYEFWNDQRLTDEEWRAQLDAATNPPRPDWQQVFLAGAPPDARNATGLEAGLFCRDLDRLGYGFWGAVPYWLAEGAPARMDADGNGIPCETVFPQEEIDGYLAVAEALAPGLRCADLDAADAYFDFQKAVAYWLLEGAPSRMDADGNGIPCESVFSNSTIEEFLRITG